MAIYTSSKDGWGDGAVDSAWVRTEPLLTPDMLQARYLFGVPLMSAMPDPKTRRVDVMTPELLKDFIQGAVADLEAEMKMPLFATRVRERLPFDKNEFESFGFFQLSRRPVSSIQSLRIESAEGTNFFEMPLNWIETGNLISGQVNIIPLSPGNMNTAFAQLSGAPAGLIYLQLLRGMQWLPAYFTCEYTVGYPDDAFPRIINNLIGIQAAMNILSNLAATHARTSSVSLGIDGMSQSVGNPGPQLFDSRIRGLDQDKQKLIGRIQAQMGLNLIFGNV